MKSAQILIVGGGPRSRALLEKAISAVVSDNGEAPTIRFADGADEALEAMVMESFAACVIRAHEANPEIAEQICQSVGEAGIRTPLVVLMDVASTELEARLLKCGAIAAIPWDGTETAWLRNVVRLALGLSKTEDTLRKSNDQLVQDMVTLQDARERAEEMTEQYVSLVEQLELARDELDKLNDQKSKFFSIIAHDLRSPFTSLLGYTTLINQMGDDLSRDEIKEYAIQINEGATRVFKLLENLLEWSRVQMDRIETEPTLFAVKDVAELTIEVLEPVAAEKQISIEQDIGSVTAYADPNQIDAVIRNLVNNAIKFTNEGGTITISATTDTGNKQTTIRVTDTGLGMSPEMAAKLFNLSESVSTDGTSGEKGTGLGLLLCKDLVEMNAGTIKAESELGKGSTFSFTLPQVAPAAADEAAAEEEAQVLT